MRILFFGSGAFGRPALQWLAQSSHEVPLVVTQPAKPAGRGRRTARTPIRQLTDELGLRIIETEDVNGAEEIEKIRSLHADLGLAVAFGQKIGASLRELIPGGILNLHASLLPKYRGAAPINWAIVRGEERTGCTVFRIVERMDAGPILTTRWTAIKPEETAGELHDRLAAIGVDAVRTALEMFVEGRIPPGTPQDEDQATRAPKLKKSDGLIRFDLPAREVADWIRGMTPWPSAVTRFESSDGRWEQVAITRARPAEAAGSPVDPPGTIDARRYVAAKEGYVEILDIKPSSGRQMTWPEYVNGRHVAAGDRFVSLDGA